MNQINDRIFTELNNIDFGNNNVSTSSTNFNSKENGRNEIDDVQSTDYLIVYRSKLFVYLIIMRKYIIIE